MGVGRGRLVRGWRWGMVMWLSGCGRPFWRWPGGGGADSSICPSDAARAVAEDWRPLMARAGEVARELARAGEVQVTQRGAVLDPDGEWRGPIRIRVSDG
ncbi:DUF3253 domain-containing protein [Actinokineospora diospyrosa]|uniref:DUF3253 domain-containing protein n=1 Tax=Actinokineospora diospyrosa TaxID=103728 RepID=UPI00338581E0